MRYELALVGPSVAPDPKAKTTESRRALRETSDRIVIEAFDLSALVQASCETMLVVAEILARYEQDPQVNDFAEAAQACVENGRAVMDKGLMLQSWETVNCGAVMIELTVRGICAALSVPYDLVLGECHRAQQAGENPAIRRVLTSAGLLQQDAEPPAHHPV